MAVIVQPLPSSIHSTYASRLSNMISSGLSSSGLYFTGFFFWEVNLEVVQAFF